MDEFEIELKRDFLNEAKDLLETTEKSFLQLENDPLNKSLVDTIFRFAHNLKGTSRAVGFGQIAELTHKAENLLLEIKSNTITVSSAVVSVLLNFNDKVREMIEGLASNLDAQFDYVELIDSLEKTIQNKGWAEVDISKIVSDEVESEAFNQDLMDEALALVAASESIKESTSELALVETENRQPVKQEIKTTVEPNQMRRETRKEDETLRVSLDRLNKMNDLIGELVILQTLVESSLSEVGEHKISRSLGKLCKDIQDLSISLRMVPIGPTFQKMTRIVRDTSKLLNKKVHLRLIGEDTEIDKTVIDGLSDPLVHIIRNAIDHGIELPEDRISDGKLDEGSVELMAFHEGNHLIIQITDDGKGIDPAKLIEKAKQKKIISVSSQLTEQQGIELIFHPGFSTKDQVSEVSGRGVGMDVVKTNIESLGGEVKVRSKVGIGSCFRLVLPLTLAIIEGMLIETEEHALIIPKSQVHEVIRLDGNLKTIVYNKRSFLRFRESVIPLFFLGEDIGTDSLKNSKVAVIVNTGEAMFAVGIKDIIKQQQVVVKPPTKEIIGKPGFMGTTILGTGKPALIIDLSNLYSKRLRRDGVLEKII